jgi:hypothetical protein
LQEDIQCSGPRGSYKTWQRRIMRRWQMYSFMLSRSDQKLQLTRLNQLETVTSGKQTDTLMADTSRFQEFQHGQAELMPDT